MESLAFSARAFAAPPRRHPARRPPVRSAQQAQVKVHAVTRPPIEAPPRGRWWIGVAVLVHAGIAGWLFFGPKQQSAAAEPPHELKLKFFKPEVVDPPKPPPPPPPQAEKKTVTPKASTPTTPVELPKVAESTSSTGEAVAVQSGPVAPPAPAPAPPPPAPEPVIEARGGIGYLNNPPPDYPRQAQVQGWEGKVVLRIRVSPDGHPQEVQVKTSSGRKILDDAAINTVQRWQFAPAKRGQTAVEGWATVPIEFRL
ncbi:energy transducer TonB [Burkholderiaceae bacterium DAT-1]|nr:energy transducer TonB [Burkholderiaceae bacterium DAT-1]